MSTPVTFTDAITNAIQYSLNGIHTAFPGKIISYDPVKRSASIQPQVDKKYTNGVTQALPILNNVPVMLPGNSSFTFSFPISPGDFCLVVCCERSIDNWLESGNQGPPSDPRKLDLSDGVAIMGLMPFSEDSNAQNNSGFEITFAGSTISIDSLGNVVIKTSNKVAIGNNVTEVLDVISSFIGNMITAIYAPPTGVLDPVTAASLTLLQTQIDALKGTIP